MAKATVNFTVSYTGLPSGNVLGFGILYEPHGSHQYVWGSGTSTPDECQLNVTPYVNSALCVVTPGSNSGTESVSFSLTFNSTQQYALYVVSAMVDKSGNLITSSESFSDFTISVTSQTVSANMQTNNLDLAVGLAIIALPFIAVIGLIVFVVRRRKRKKTDGSPEGLASSPAPAPVPIAEGTKFCADCGVRMPVTSRFCASCGSQQD